MGKSSSNRIRINVRTTPVLFSSKRLYHIPDFAYGEWIIFEEGSPRYYFNLFDEQYASVKEQLTSDVESYLNEQFNKRHLKLSTRHKAFGIPLRSKATMIELNLERLPLEYLI